MNSPEVTASKPGPRAGFLPARVVHLHASRFCNLTCRHCYSSSGPGYRHGLDPLAVVEGLAVLKTEGYDVLSLSGGEPLLYEGIREVVVGASDLGYQVNLVSNGAPVQGRGLDLIREYVTLTAISLDGGPEVHVDLRGHPLAFDWAERAADNLRAAGVKFGIAFCVSRASLADMPWVVEWAREKKASLVQFHPFAPTGRGEQMAGRLDLRDAEKARAFMIATLLASTHGPEIHIDLASSDAVRAQRDAYRVLERDNDFGGMPLADLVNPLIIDESGLLVPLSYGVNPAFGIGQLGASLEESVLQFKAGGWTEVRGLLTCAFDRLRDDRPGFVDWFYHLVKTSHDAD